MKEIDDMIADTNAAFQRLRASEAPKDAIVSAGRKVRFLIGDLTMLSWSLDNDDERTS